MEPYVEIGYKGFCALGGLTNPRLMTRALRNARGEYLMTIYLYRRY